jgi:photosystem II stability/assembly factor-like uncharacterized protein
MRFVTLAATKASLLVTSLIGLLLSPGQFPASSNATSAILDRQRLATPTDTGISRVRQTLGRLPLSFEENRGQAGSNTSFICRTDRFAIYLSPTESVLALTGYERNDTQSSIYRQHVSERRRSTTGLRFRFVGADPEARVTGSEELPGKSNYFVGNDSGRWRKNVPTYARVTCEQIYEGVDIVYYGNHRQLEYDLILAPGADLTAVRIAFDGADAIRLSNGDLVLETALGEIRQVRPIAYQDTVAGRQAVAADYVIRSNREVGFELGRFDNRHSVIVDPVLSYSSFLGGDDLDVGSDIAVDASGFIYIGGSTASNNFPISQGAVQRSLNRFSVDAFITKLNPEATQVVYSTYLGGSSTDGSFGGVDGFSRRQGAVSLAVGPAGNVFVTGATYSSDFPVTPGAFQLNHADDSRSDSFITNLSPGGDKLVYSSYLGGKEDDLASDIAVDNSGAVFLTGNTYSRDFPTASALQPAHATDECSGGDFIYLCSDAFVTKLDLTGSSLVYSTYLGGARYDAGTSIAVGADGGAFVAGLTGSSNFPTTAGAIQTRFNGSSLIYLTQPPNAGDAFVSRLSASGTELIYSTYLGGRSDDAALALSVDSAGNAYLTGRTDSIDFPVTEGTFSSNNAGTAAYNTRDSSDNWNAIKNGLAAAEISALAIDPRTPSTIYAASSATSYPDGRGAKIFKSTDAGASWISIFTETVLFNGVSLINSLAVDPKNPSIIYAGALDRIYKSTNGGGQWLRAGGVLTFPFASVNTIAIDPRNTQRVYAGTGIDTFGPLGGGIFSSTNGGETWEPTKINSLLQTVGIVFSLTIDPKETKKLYAGTNRGVFRGLKRGRKWKETDLDDPSLSVRAIALDPVTRSTIYAAVVDRFIDFLASDDGGVYKSTDGGQRWQRLETGFERLSVSSLALDPKNPSTIYAGLQKSSTGFTAGRHFEGAQGGVLKSTDGGNHWTLAGLGDVSVNALAVDPEAPANLYAGAYGDIDIFVSKLNPDGSSLIYSTYLGGRAEDSCLAIAVDAAGNAALTGGTTSLNFPSLDAFQPGKAGGSSNTDAFVALLNAQGRGLVYSSYLGGSAEDVGLSIFVTATGAAYVTGITDSSSFPVVNPFQQTYGGASDAFVVRIGSSRQQ